MPLYKYIPFINDAYYYNNIKDKQKKSSFDYENYKKIFFNESENYTIRLLGNIVEEKYKVKMVRYDVINPKKTLILLFYQLKEHLIKKMYTWI